MVVILIVVILFIVMVCIWDYVTDPSLFENFVTSVNKKLVKLPKRYAISKKDELVSLSREPLLLFSSLKPYFESLSPDNMSIVFELTTNENNIPERDLISFETMTHCHRISLTKTGPTRKLKMTTKAFPPKSLTDHNESIRLYEFKVFVDLTKQKEGFEASTAAKKEIVQYAIVYNREHCLIFEQTLNTVFTEIERFDYDSLSLSSIDFAKEEVIVFLGSSDVKENDSCLVRNVVLYNGVLGEEELGELSV